MKVPFSVDRYPFERDRNCFLDESYNPESFTFKFEKDKIETKFLYKESANGARFHFYFTPTLQYKNKWIFGNWNWSEMEIPQSTFTKDVIEGQNYDKNLACSPIFSHSVAITIWNRRSKHIALLNFYKSGNFIQSHGNCFLIKYVLYQNVNKIIDVITQRFFVNSFYFHSIDYDTISALVYKMETNKKNKMNYEVERDISKVFIKA